MKLKVWWIPQIPMDAFEVEVASVEEGVKVMDILADYDNFQYENKVKGDYCNMGGIVQWNGEEWDDWWSEEFMTDDPYEYVEEKKIKLVGIIEVEE